MKTSLYIFDISELTLDRAYKEFSSYLTKDRLDKIKDFKLVKPKLHSFGAGIAFYFSLLELGFSEDYIRSLCLKTGQYGKPFIYNKDLYFNISHSGDLVTIVWSDISVGCDVEECFEKDFISIAKRFFTEEENQLLNSIKDINEKQKVFFRIWTLKEAYIKQDGRGLGIELNSFSVPINQKCTNESYRINDIYLREYFPYEEYCISVASASDNFDNNVVIIKI